MRDSGPGSPRGMTVRCRHGEFQAEYRQKSPDAPVVSLAFEDWYPVLGEQVTLVNGTSERRATVHSVRVSPHGQRVELSLRFLDEAAER